MTNPNRDSRISQAFDITLSQLLTSNPRKYGRYLPARHRFFSAFPGGLFYRLPTPSTHLLCAFHALILSFTHQHPSLNSSSSVPTLAQLQDIFSKQSEAYRELTGMDNTDNLSGDQLAAVFAEWVRDHLPGRRGQLGYLSEVEGWEFGDGYEGGRDVPVMMDTGDVKTEEEGEGGKGDIIRVWVWNDGGWVGGWMGHWEGVRGLKDGEGAL